MPTSRLSEFTRRLGGRGVGARLARGASGAFSIKIAAGAVAFGLQVLLARLLGANEYGTFTYAFSWISVLVVFSQLGLGNAVLRFTSSYAADQAWGRLRGLLRQSDRWVLGAAVGVGLAGWVGIAGWGERFDASLVRSFAVGFLGLPLLALLSVKESAVRGLDRPVLGLIPDSLVRPLGTAAILALCYLLLPRPLGASEAMAATVAGFGLALLVAMGMLRRALPDVVRQTRPDVGSSREWWGVAASLFVITVMNILRTRVDVLMIGSLLGTGEVGFYAAAARYAELMFFALQAVNAYAAPVIAGLHSQGRTSEIQRMASLGVLAVALVGVPLALVLVLGGLPLLGLFGPEFVAGYPVLVWLTAGYLFKLLAGSVDLLMMMTGHHRAAAKIITASAVLNVILNAVLIPAAGIAGAAMATAMTVVLGNAAMSLLVFRRLRIDPTLLAWLRRPWRSRRGAGGPGPPPNA